MVWLACTVGLILISDHDIGKLVDGHRAPGDGSITLCLGVFSALHHGYDFCCGELAGGFECIVYAGRPF